MEPQRMRILKDIIFCFNFFPCVFFFSGFGREKREGGGFKEEREWSDVSLTTIVSEGVKFPFGIS